MLHHVLRDLIRYAQQMQPKQWLLLLFAVVVLGLFCLRGMGSRTNY